MGEPPRNPSDRKNENESVLIGELFDEKYRITGKLGGGGMGLVYEAQHEWMERRVALKVLRPNFIAADDYEVFLERFKREAQTASRITHPNAVTIYDFGIFNEMPYLAMQFIEGKTINELIKENGPFEHARACSLLLQALDAVDAAHALQIIHRDIKPDNIMVAVSPNGAETVHVLDFGIAKVLDAAESNASMTLPGKTVGTPRYMSPEQVLARTIDVRTDIYALGLVLYEMLSGDIPFKADSSMQLMFHHVNTAPLPIRDVNTTALTSKRLEQLVMKALQKDPEKRFQSVSEMKEALQAAILAAPSKTSISIPSFSTTKLPAAIAGNQKKSLIAIGGALGVGLLIVGTLAFQSLGGEDDGGESATLEGGESSPADHAASEKALSTDPTQLAALKSPVKQGSPSDPTSKTSEDTLTAEPTPARTDGSELSNSQLQAPLNNSSSPQKLGVESDNADSRGNDGSVKPEPVNLESALSNKTPAASSENATATIDQPQNSAEKIQGKLQAAEPSTSAVNDKSASIQAVKEALAAATSATKSAEQTPTQQGTELLDKTPPKPSENQKPTEASAKVSADLAERRGTSDSVTSDSVTSEKPLAPEAKVTPKEVAPTKTPNTASDSKAVAAQTSPAKSDDTVDVATNTASTKSVNPSESSTTESSSSSFSATPIPILIKHLAGEDRIARENAAIELQNRGKAPVPALIETLDSHPSPRARFWAVFILGKLRAVESTESIVRALKDESGMVSETAKKALRAVNPSRADKLLGSNPESQPQKKQTEEKPNSGFLGIF